MTALAVARPRNQRNPLYLPAFAEVVLGRHAPLEMMPWEIRGIYRALTPSFQRFGQTPKSVMLDQGRRASHDQARTGQGAR